MSSKIGNILVQKNIITELNLREAIERKDREPEKYLGQILCEMGLPQSKIIKVIYQSNKRKQLGQILVDLKIITETQLQDSLARQKELRAQGKYAPLGALMTQNRTITEENYITALSAHFSMPIVSLKDFTINPARQKIIGEQFALKNRIIVLNNASQKVTVAMAEPQLFILESIERAMPKGKSVLFCLARSSEIEICLDKKYDPFIYV